MKNLRFSVEQTILRIAHEKALLKSQLEIFENDVKRQIQSSRNYFLIILSGFFLNKLFLGGSKFKNSALPKTIKKFSRTSKFTRLFAFFSSAYEIVALLQFFKKKFFKNDNKA